jgi:DNA repair exonuclease SbcCD ATPase subunit
MRIVRFTAENYKKLKVVEIVPDGSVIQITGPNGSGKTSILDAIWVALGGSEGIPSKPIRTGEQRASVTLALGEGKDVELEVIRRFTPKGTTLTVEGARGAQYKSPQKMLDDLMGALTFDPLAFSRMAPKEQLETLRGMVKLDVDIDQLDDNYAEAYEARAEKNRTIKSLGAQAESIILGCDVPDEPVNVADILEEMTAAEKRNADIDRAIAESESHKRRAKELRDRIEKVKQELKSLEASAKAEDEMSQIHPVAKTDTSALRDRIQNCQAINTTVADKKRREALQKELKATELQADTLTQSMEKIAERKSAAIASAKMPVPGLLFGDGELLFNGLPLNQASDAEQLRISVAIAMAANPKLRVLRIRDGSLLDENSMAMLTKMVEDNNYQAWIEVVDTSGKVGVVMEDGQVVGSETPNLEFAKKDELDDL